MSLRKALKNRNRIIRIKYPVYCGITVLFWCLLVILLLQHYIQGENFLDQLLVATRLIMFVSISSIQNVAETVGFGSFLLVWIYAALDRQELGLRCSSLLQSLYPAYYIFLISHLISMLLCIALCSVGIIGGALLALCIVIWGGGLHVRVLSILIFNSERRRWAAANVWERRLLHAVVDDTYLHEICAAAAVLTLEKDSATQRILRYFHQGLFRYVGSIYWDMQTEPRAAQNALMNLAQVWENLLLQRTEQERMALATDLLSRTAGGTHQKPGNDDAEQYAAALQSDSRKLANDYDRLRTLMDELKLTGDERKAIEDELKKNRTAWKINCVRSVRIFLNWVTLRMEICLQRKGLVTGWKNLLRRRSEFSRNCVCLDAICLGYVICIYRLYAAEKSTLHNENIPLYVKDHLQALCLCCSRKEVIRCLSVAAALLSWNSMYCKKIPFNSSFLVAIHQKEKDWDRPLFNAMIQLLLQSEFSQRTFDMLYPHVFN